MARAGERADADALNIRRCPALCYGRLSACGEWHYAGKAI